MKAGAVKLHEVLADHFRYDASFHLSEGRTVRRHILGKCPYKLTTIEKVSERIFYGNRAKRVYVSSPEHGIPFLSSSDILQADLDNVKLASKKYTPDLEGMKLQKGWILISRSGTVGNCAFASRLHAQKLASEDVIRLVPDYILRPGLIYAYLASKYGHALLTQGVFGAVIQHIEPAFVGSLPIPVFPEDFQSTVDDLIQDSTRLREDANDKLEEAIKLFESSISSKHIYTGAQTGSIPYKQIVSKFHRFDSQYQIGKKLLSAEMKGQYTVKIGSIKDSIFIGNRGKRYYVNKNGIPFLSSSDMLLANPVRFCKYISKNTPGLENLLAHEGNILISRSGTVGNTIMVNKSMEGFAVSEHAMRLIVDSSKIEPEYVYAYLKTNQGQDALHILPYGSVIVTLGEEFLADVDLPIVEDNTKSKIVELVKDSNNGFATAVDKENEAIFMVEQEIEKWNKS